MEEHITIPKTVYNTLIGAAQSYVADLSSGLEEGIYEEGAEDVERIEAAIDFEPVKVDVFVFVEGGNIQGASATIPLGFEVFDKDNFKAEERVGFDDEAAAYNENSLIEWNQMIKEGTNNGTLTGVY